MIKLYQMPISHFCEKARWALDYKRLPYKNNNLLIGLHARKAKKLTGQTGLPIIQDGKSIVHGSASIIDFLDEQYPRFPLTPEDAVVAEDAVVWEALADEDVGPHVRRICYFYLLDEPDILMTFFTHQGPWYSHLFMSRALPKIVPKMRALMDITPSSVEKSKKVVQEAMARILERLAQGNYLTGDKFTRADLAVAALFAPFFCPAKYPLDWPSAYPSAMSATIDEFRAIEPYVQRIYQSHR